MKCFQINISGDIQGKGFRFTAMHIAHTLHVKGFVQYTGDHDILIEAEGDETSLNDFIEWCTTGPFSSQTSSIRIIETDVKGYQSFDIHNTGHEQTTQPSIKPARSQISRFFKRIVHMLS